MEKEIENPVCRITKIKTGCRYLRQAIRSIGGDRGAAGIRFSGRPRLAAGAGVQASAMRGTDAIEILEGGFFGVLVVYVNK